MSQSLFRAQVRAHRQDAWLGRIVLIRPVSFTVLCAVAGAIVVAMLAYLALGEYTRKARLSGMLAPQKGVVRLVAQQSGVVESVLASEGQSVAKDAVLVTLTDGRTGAAHVDIGSAVQARIAERSLALEAQRRHVAAAAISEQASFAKRRLALERELAQIGTEIDWQVRRTELAGRAALRARELEVIGFLAASAADREKEAAMEQDSRLEALRRERLGIEREIATGDLDRDAARARAAAQVAALDLQSASLQQERLERELQYRASIVSPMEGIVAAVLVERGQTVAPGMTLATMVPRDATLEAQLFSASKSIGFVRVGQEVQLRYVAYPHQKFGSHRAVVSAVSSTPLSPGELGFTPPDGSREPVYRIRAQLAAQSIVAYGAAQPLQSGMAVEADVLLDRRRLIEWIFDPLFSLAGRA